jgi:hypothetical protein
VDTLVVHGFHPGGEQLVQLCQGLDLGQCARDGELDEELLTYGPEYSFNFAAACGLSG